MINRLKIKLSFLKKVIKITYKAIFDKDFDIKKELQKKEFLNLRRDMQSEIDKYFKVNAARTPYRLFNSKQKKELAVEKVAPKASKQTVKTKTPNKKRLNKESNGL